MCAVCGWSRLFEFGCDGQCAATLARIPGPTGSCLTEPAFVKLTYPTALLLLLLFASCAAPPPRRAMPALSPNTSKGSAVEPPMGATHDVVVGSRFESSHVLTGLWQPRVAARAGDTDVGDSDLGGTARKGPESSTADSLAAGPLAVRSLTIGPSRSTPQRGRRRGVHGSAHLLFAGRNYRSSLGFSDDQGVIGVDASVHYGRFPLGFEFGFSGAADNREARFGNFYADVGSSASEFYLGGRITGDLARGRVRPYVGTGVTFLNVEADRLSNQFIFTDDDTTVAGYVHGGALFQFGQGRARFSIGLDVRWVYSADVVLFGDHLDVDYLQIGPTFGVTF